MEYLKSERKNILYSILLGLAGGLVGVSLFGLSGYMISLSFFDPPFFIIVLIIAVIKFFGMMKGAFKYIERLLSHDATFRLIGRLRLNYFKAAIQHHADTHSVKFIQRLNQYFEEVENYYIRIVYPYIVALLLSMLLIILSIYFGSVFVIMSTVVALVLLYAIPKMFEKRVTNDLRARNGVEDALYGRLYHYIHDFTDLFVTGRMQDKKKEISQEISRVKATEDKIAFSDAAMQFIAQLLQIAALLFIIFWLYEDMPLLVPMIMLLVLSYFDLVMPVMQPASRYRSVKEAVGVLNAETSPKPTITNDVSLDQIDVTLLDYRYATASVDVLKGITANFRRGEKHAIIGSSGSGKTTLLERIIEGGPSIRLGHDSEEVSQEALLQNASIMPQHLDFYNASVTDNVTLFGHLNRTREEVVEDLELMEMSYYTPEEMIEFTGRLSGGEQKRLHFIRMLAEDKSWWIMDEPTARLDDRLKQKMWDQILSQPTVIVSTHDLSRLEEFDYIHYMEQGSIIESGSYSRLMAEKGHVFQAVQRFNDYL
ncbi:ATP-binding cassette domain-containing protein [Salinicoccus siamensis]|uniref:ATP-binding cassette domain-containing protein n=1 Tax=Salinicoccus siamensis TaxID=381830 RepID=A0ABV5Z0E7_9STAP